MKLTRRGRLVRMALILALIVALWWIAANVWWTGAGWCIGSLTSCMA